MRLFLIANLLILSVGIGYSFRITEFLDPFFRNVNANHPERQSEDNEIEDQVLPLFLVTFAATTLWNLITMGAMNTEVDCDEYHWCYEGDCAPSTWGQCTEACNGMHQSPIDIPEAVQMGSASGTKTLMFSNYENVRVDVFSNTVEHYKNRYGSNVDGNGDRITDGTLQNNGHTAQLDVVQPSASDGVLSGGPLQSGSKYNILQLHFHWGSDDTKGSEHTYGGKMYPIEMHIVHKRDGFEDFLNTPTGLAVTGFMFEIDSMDNPALTPLTDALEKIVDSKSELSFSGTSFNINDLITPSINSEYAYYKGSLTTPTCNEVVEWINILTPLKISSAQLAKFRTLMDGKNKPIQDNFRPVQPLNGRTVTKYGQ